MPPLFLSSTKIKNFEWTLECQKAFEELKEYLGQPPLLSQLEPRDELRLYLAISEYAISAILVRKVDNQQKPVYYVSRVMVDTETKYAPAK